MKRRAVSMADIARLAGVSKNTVSLALRNDPQIPENTRLRISALSERLGYRKNATVAHLMAELRRTQALPVNSSLALLNANTEARAFTEHPTIPTYVEGCTRGARHLGYNLDHFWLHDPNLDGMRLNRILKARGILGTVVVGLMDENFLPPRFLPTWEKFPTVVTGVHTREPALSFASTDHHMLTLRAFQKARELGYSRPALVLDGRIDRLVDGRFSAGMQVASQQVPRSQRTKPFHLVREAERTPELFYRWFQKERPDVILTLYNGVKLWLSALSLHVPGDIGLIQLEWRSTEPEWAGMNQHNDIVGEAAVEMVIGMIHHGGAGLPAFPRATLVESSWIDGTTVLSA